jgi:hypothetical protein
LKAAHCEQPFVADCAVGLPHEQYYIFCGIPIAVWEIGARDTSGSAGKLARLPYARLEAEESAAALRA